MMFPTMTEAEYNAMATGKPKSVQSKQLTIELATLNEEQIKTLFLFLGNTPGTDMEMLTTAAGKYYLDAVLPIAQKGGELLFKENDQRKTLSVEEFRHRALQVLKRAAKAPQQTAQDKYAQGLY